MYVCTYALCYAWFLYNFVVFHCFFVFLIFLCWIFIAAKWRVCLLAGTRYSACQPVHMLSAQQHLAARCQEFGWRLCQKLTDVHTHMHICICNKQSSKNLLNQRCKFVCDTCCHVQLFRITNFSRHKCIYIVCVCTWSPRLASFSLCLAKFPLLLFLYNFVIFRLLIAKEIFIIWFMFELNKCK